MSDSVPVTDLLGEGLIVKECVRSSKLRFWIVAMVIHTLLHNRHMQVCSAEEH